MDLFPPIMSSDGLRLSEILPTILGLVPPKIDGA